MKDGGRGIKYLLPQQRPRCNNIASKISQDYNYAVLVVHWNRPKSRLSSDSFAKMVFFQPSVSAAFTQTNLEHLSPTTDAQDHMKGLYTMIAWRPMRRYNSPEFINFAPRPAQKRSSSFISDLCALFLWPYSKTSHQTNIDIPKWLLMSCASSLWQIPIANLTNISNPFFCKRNRSIHSESFATDEARFPYFLFL